MARPRPLILTILDGWGFSPAVEGNAIAAARKPTYDKLLREYPNTLIQTSGPSVGLPEGQMGNSEVGHLNIGAGRVSTMDVTRIDQMIDRASFPQSDFAERDEACPRTPSVALARPCERGRRSFPTHAPLCAARNGEAAKAWRDVFVHCFMDGRDTPPNSGAGLHSRRLQTENAARSASGKIASVSGRYYAMDRDKRWERIERAFGAMVQGTGTNPKTRGTRSSRSYEAGMTDEFIEPVTIVDRPR